MHELGIMYHVIRQVTGIARENELTEVEAIVLQVGEYASVIPGYLHACFPAAVDGILKNTKLERCFRLTGSAASAGRYFICRNSIISVRFAAAGSMNFCPDANSFLKKSGLADRR